MPDPQQLPYLLKLLEDESETVRETVLKELSSFGPYLEQELAHQNITIDEYQLKLMRSLLDESNRRWLQEAWSSWFELEDDKAKLELAQSLLAEFQNGRYYPVKLKSLLDQLAKEYRSRNHYTDALELSNFLFKVKKIAGVEESDYYNPLNSNLVHVIEKKRGIPISLASIYILVGHRLGLDIEGINFPGHFLTRAISKGRVFIIDCFNGGNVMSLSKKKPTVQSGDATGIQDIRELECDAEMIIARVLRNLMKAYQQEGNLENVALMGELLEMMEEGKEEL